MKSFFGFALLTVLLLVGWTCPAEGRIRQTSDAIIVEAEVTNGDRKSRSTEGSVEGTLPGSTYLMTAKTCWTPEGKLGQCVTVRSCYPHVKLPALGSLETWVIGTSGTCHYIEPDSSRFYGICCPTKFENPKEVAALKSQQSSSPSLQNSFPQQENTDSSDSSVVTDSKTIRPAPSAKANCGAGPYRALSFLENSRIVGGQTAIPNSWPFIVSLQTQGRHFCGGSLIDATHILTAAHCVAHLTSFDVAKLDVVLGAHKIKPLDSTAIKMKVLRVTRHKGYNAKTMFNDVALLTMGSSVNFGNTIKPICLPTSNSDQHTGKDATVMGWGSLKEGGSLPSELQQVTVQVGTNSDCKSKYSVSSYDIVDHMLCAAAPNKDSCQGDSGGPLVTHSAPGAPWTQVGVVSWGIGCAQASYPGVYTRVTSFLNWIQKNSQ